MIIQISASVISHGKLIRLLFPLGDASTLDSQIEQCQCHQNAKVWGCLSRYQQLEQDTEALKRLQLAYFLWCLSDHGGCEVHLSPVKSTRLSPTYSPPPNYCPFRPSFNPIRLRRPSVNLTSHPRGRLSLIRPLVLSRPSEMRTPKRLTMFLNCVKLYKPGTKV